MTERILIVHECHEMRATRYSNLFLFYPFLRTPGNIHFSTKKRKKEPEIELQTGPTGKDVGLQYASVLAW